MILEDNSWTKATLTLMKSKIASMVLIQSEFFFKINTVAQLKFDIVINFLIDFCLV